MQEAFKFWMVWREGSPTTNHRHLSRADADAEAERLAKINPGECFYVLKTVGAVAADHPPVRRLKLTQDDVPF